MNKKKEDIELDKKKEQNPHSSHIEPVVSDSLAVSVMAEEAIALADKMLQSVEAIYADEKKRTYATGFSGLVLGSGVNYLLDAANETDAEKKSELTERGVVSLTEVGVAALKTLIAGERRRRKRLKKG